jgi:hypothetical protein
MAAVEAFLAGDMVKDDDAIADVEIADAGADGGDHPGCFVAENPRRSQQVVFDFLEIGVTDSAAFHADQQLARADDRRGDGLDRNPAVAGIDGGAHRGGWGDDVRNEC